MTWLLNFVHTHALDLIAAWAIFSNIVAALPTPDEAQSPGWYKKLWVVLHFLAMNIPRVIPALRVSKTDKPGQGGYVRFGLLLYLAAFALLFLMFNCAGLRTAVQNTPPEQIARDAIAASRGVLVTAQAKYQAQCVAQPQADPCVAITRAIAAQHMTVDGLRVYCGFLPSDPDSKLCVPLKSALPALQAAVGNLNGITADVQRLIQ